LRHHQSIIDLKNKIANGDPKKVYDIELSYITSRGGWYQISWKGDNSKSGGVATNIGIHFFDMLLWIFGGVKDNQVIRQSEHTAEGHLTLERARVKWMLSIDASTLPKSAIEKNQRTFRSIRLEGQEIEFSEGFTDLHTKSYQEILNGNGFGLADARPSIELVHAIRNAK
jgi:UDP-N-acetyl-2-amino-2-deoxyglucuronate dehydrogenase